MSWSRALRCVRNGRAAAPPLVSWRIGVSTSMKPRCVERRAQALEHGGLGAHHLARLGPHHHVDVAQPDPGLVGERLVLVGQRAQRLGRDRPGGRLHRQLAAAAGDHLARAPRAGRRCRPVALKSASDSSPTSASESITWSSVPSPSRSRTKQSLPVLRRKITRPATATVSPVRVSGSSSCPSYVARTSASVWVRSTVTGYGGTTGLDQPLPLLPAHPHLLGKVVALRARGRLRRLLTHARKPIRRLLVVLRGHGRRTALRLRAGCGRRRSRGRAG